MKLKIILLYSILHVILFVNDLYADDVLKKYYDDVLVMENYFDELSWESEECGSFDSEFVDKIIKQYTITCERASYYDGIYLREVYRLKSFDEVYQKVFLPLNLVVGNNRLTKLPNKTIETKSATYIYYKNILIIASECTHWLKKLDNGYIEHIKTCYF